MLSFDFVLSLQSKGLYRSLVGERASERASEGKSSSSMAADDGGVNGGDGGAVVVVEDMDMPCSPRNKMKFLCSHGGKILPRPVDGNLKYVGGETRVVAVPRDITFSGPFVKTEIRIRP